MATAEPSGATEPGQGGSEASLPGYVLPAIVLLAFVLRAVMALRTSAMFEDGPHFLDIANRFSNGDFEAALAHPYHPLYSAVTALTNVVVGDMEVAALLVSVVGGTAAVGASFVFLREGFDSHVAAFGAFLFAVTPYGVRFTADIQSEGIYLAFFLTGLALLIRGVKTESVPVFVMAGMSSGFAYLARPEGAGLVGVGVVLIAIQRLGGNIGRGKAFASSIGLCAGALVVAALYLQTLARQQALFVLSGKKSLLRTLGFGDDWSALLRLDFESLLGTGAVYWAILVLLGLCLLLAMKRGENSQPIAKQRGIRRGVIIGVALAVAVTIGFLDLTATFVGVVISTLRPEVALLLAIWLFVPIRNTPKRSDTLIAVALVLYLVVLVGLLANYGYLSRRHVLPLVPLVLGYAGLGAVILGDLAIKTWPGRLTSKHRPVLLASLALVMLLIAAPKTLHDHRRDVLAQRLAAEWLLEQGLLPGPVASNKRRTGYYAERRWFPLTVEGELRSFEALARERVRYIVVDDRLLGLRDGLEATPGFELRELHRLNAGGRIAMVYELLDAHDPVQSPISAAPPTLQ